MEEAVTTATDPSRQIAIQDWALGGAKGCVLRAHT